MSYTARPNYMWERNIVMYTEITRNCTNKQQSSEMPLHVFRHKVIANGDNGWM